jgi:hypothetical protein
MSDELLGQGPCQTSILTSLVEQALDQPATKRDLFSLERRLRDSERRHQCSATDFSSWRIAPEIRKRVFSSAPDHDNLTPTYAVYGVDADGQEWGFSFTGATLMQSLLDGRLDPSGHLDRIDRGTLVPEL